MTAATVAAVDAFDQGFYHPTDAQTIRELEYEPRNHFLSLHQRNERWACIVAHRRAGKTVACVNELIIRALYTHKRNARYSYIAPFYSQAKDVAWQYLKDFSSPFVTSARDVRESELSVTLLNGAKIRLYGADNPDALRGVYNDGVILDEYGDCRPSLWGQVVLPTLADRRGWAVFIGTPKGKNHFHDIYRRSIEEDGWYHATLKASTSGILPPDEMAEMRAQMSEEEWLQEMECDFSAAVLGTYYASILNDMEARGQIKRGFPEWDPDQPVHAVADLGYKDSTALWFWQHAPDGVAIIDYYEAAGKKLAHYMDFLDSKPYSLSKLWLPHDARAKTLQTGRSTIEQFLDPPQTDEEDRPLTYHRESYPADIVPNLKKQQGIDAARLVLPHCYMNVDTCYAGIEALRAYRREYDEVKKVFRKDPRHDWASDGADSFRYLALVARTKLPNYRPRPRFDGLPAKPPEITLDMLFEDRENSKKFQFERDRVAA